MSKYSLFINPISVPVQVGIYDDDKLIKSIELVGMVSDMLIQTINEILDSYDIAHIVYVNGPGSHMATKLTYIMLESIRILRGIEFFGCSGFELNESRVIKAVGNLYFIKEKETIITKKFDEIVDQRYELKELLDDISLESDNRPNYILPAVQR